MTNIGNKLKFLLLILVICIYKLLISIFFFIITMYNVKYLHFMYSHSILLLIFKNFFIVFILFINILCITHSILLLIFKNFFIVFILFCFCYKNIDIYFYKHFSIFNIFYFQILFWNFSQQWHTNLFLQTFFYFKHFWFSDTFFEIFINNDTQIYFHFHLH